MKKIICFILVLFVVIFSADSSHISDNPFMPEKVSLDWHTMSGQEHEIIPTKDESKIKSSRTKRNREYDDDGYEGLSEFIYGNRKLLSVYSNYMFWTIMIIKKFNQDNKTNNSHPYSHLMRPVKPLPNKSDRINIDDIFNHYGSCNDINNQSNDYYFQKPQYHDF